MLFQRGGHAGLITATAGLGILLFPGAGRAKKMVRAEGFEPTQALRPSGFSYHLRLSPPRPSPEGYGAVCGLDYPFTLPRIVSGD